MFKYIIWVVKICIPVLWDLFTWMWPYGRRPDRYSQEKRRLKGQKLAKRVLKSFKVDVEVRNMPIFNRDEVYYFVSNHTSVMDLVVLFSILPLPISFISKDENRKIPFVRTLMKVYKGLYIERNNLHQEIKVMQEMRDSLAKKEVSWLIFPEGTRNKDYHGSLLDYKAGAFKAPLSTQTSIAPIVQWGNQVIMPLKNRARRYKVIVEFLPLVKLEGTTQEIANEIYKVSNKTMMKLREEYFALQSAYKPNKHVRKLIALPTDETN
ncbi:MAG: 1-acyl-sn-glycerol-3-phosphate acyltransferase [Tenericutes bacterium ADurb.Bin239]|nr:MAG: 1-acyl-sn-glycerol-3-phosphate acyltransferase [Tenericutes bacterium ADurb.Bin239]